MFPMLLSRISLNGYRSGPGLRKRYLDAGFGCLLDIDLPSLAETLADVEWLEGNLLAEWRRCVAEELLLRHACEVPNPGNWLAEFEAVSPFGRDQPILADCLRSRSACGIFPLAGTRQDDPPGIGHVWVFTDLAHRTERNGCEIIPGDLAFCTVATDEWDGRSWQLAAGLAARSLQTDAPDGIVERLARRWIITGRLDKEGHTVKVNLGNKLKIPTLRHWLLPLENLPDVPPAAAGQTIRSAIDLDAAWSHVSGIGTRADGEKPWPKEVDELHILVGGDIKAGVASALFCPPDTRVQLWHSDSETFSILPSQTLERVVAALRPDLNILKPLRIDSANLVAAENDLRKAFGNCPSGRRVLFNITSGNRLMSYAVQNATRGHPNIQLVYRDADAGDFEFTCLDHSEFPPASRVLRGYRREGVNWDWLFTRTKPGTRAAKSPEDMAAEFLCNIRATTARGRS